jgi:integrase
MRRGTRPSVSSIKAMMAESGRCTPRLRLRLAAISGARRGELCALRWSDFDLKGGWLTIARSLSGGRADELVEKDTKTHAKRRVSLDAETRSALEAHRGTCEHRARDCDAELPPSAFVFSDMPDGSAPWRPSRITVAFRRLSTRLAVDGVRFHDYADIRVMPTLWSSTCSAGLGELKLSA